MANHPWRSSLVPLAAGLALVATNARGDEPPKAVVRVEVGKAAGSISPKLYGQFLEFMYEGVKGGLHAELLRDRGFEEPANAIGLPRHWERYPDDRNDDYALSFDADDAENYPVVPRPSGKGEGEVRGPGKGLKVEVGRGVIPRHGIYQPRIPLRAGVAYRGSIWVKAKEYRGRVAVAIEQDIEGGKVYDEARLGEVGKDWTRLEFRLEPKVDDPLARFVVLFPGAGTLWVDQASLIPEDAGPGDVRADVLDRIAGVKPAYLRWPGGNVAQDYHWRWGVGPRDARPVWTNYAWKSEAEPGDFGTDEYLALCHRVKAEPTLTINVEGRGATVAEAADWVAYCNAPIAHPEGARRSANGHPEPYGVTLWEIGNEIFGDWVRGHTDAKTYAENFLRYARAIRAVEPKARFIAVGDNDMAWNRTVLEVAGREIDYLAVHHYYGRGEEKGDVRNLMARPLHYGRFYESLRGEIARAVPGRTIGLAINEWGLDMPPERQYGMDSALYGARLMNVFERTGGLVSLSAVSDLLNGWPGGIIQASRHGVFVSPLYHVNALYAGNLGSDLLASTVDGPTFDSTLEGKAVPALDVVASRSADGRTLILKAVNTDREHPLALTIALDGLGDGKIGPKAGVATLEATRPGAFNGFSHPDDVTVHRREVDASALTAVTLPAGSVSVITLSLEPRPLP